MQQWVYVSRCIVPADELDRASVEIIRICQSRNVSIEVTGTLVFTGTYFAQVIEGPPRSIMSLKSSILADQRHSDVRPVLDCNIRTRRFRKWSVADWGASLVVSRAVHRCVRDSPGDRKQAADHLVDLLTELALGFDSSLPALGDPE